MDLSQGRDGFGPKLTLSYDSAGTPSAFGTGWSMEGVLAVSVATRRRLPSYDSEEVYSFTLSGELVPTSETTEIEDHTVKRWRARREDSHVRVEQWTHNNTGRVHWRTRDAANTLSVYGQNPDDSTRIANPDDPHRVFAWLVEKQFDTSGNAIFYEYAAEDRSTLSDADRNQPYERGRAGATAQRYLRNIYYGNSVPLAPGGEEPADNTWHLRVELEYTARPDAYSTYAPGFEVRTYRLCERIAQYHDFEALGGEELVAAYDLDHQPDPAGTRLLAVNYTGFSGEEYKSVPPLTFAYTEPEVEQHFGDAPVEAARNTPGGITGRHRWMDLYGDGLPGILTETSEAWLYKTNEGAGRFGPQTVVAALPAYTLDQVALADFDADGNPNLAVLHGRSGGYYTYDRDTETWQGFRNFEELPHIEAAQSRAQWLDVNGDGRAELVVADAERFTWYPSLGERGFGEPVTVELPATYDAPFAENMAVDFRFADMCGHGLADQVRVRNGRVEYWPQHGRGRFGEPVLMDGSPLFAPQHEFDSNRALLVDLNGTGTADIVYLGSDEVRWWYNAAGNRLLPGGRIPISVDNLSTVRVIDFLGDGTPCLVWSSPYPDDVDDIRFLRLTSGVKPHLITEIDTGMGARHALEYASSSEHYLRDRRVNRKWSTKLPSHTTVVDTHEVHDLVGGERALSRYEYHDGRFDHEERLLMFGAVDRWDTDPETDTDTTGSCVRNWFHPGTNLLRLVDVWHGDADEAELPYHVVDDAALLLAGEYEHAVSGLAGRLLREETFAVSPQGQRAENPLTVSRNSYAARKLTDAVAGFDPSLAVYRAQQLSCVYEEIADDPRTLHEMTLDVTPEGVASLIGKVTYPRRGTAATPQQTQLRAAVHRAETVTVDEPQRWEPGIDIAQDEYELTGFNPAASGIFDYQLLRDEVISAIAAPVAFDASPPPQPSARLIGSRRSYFWDNAGTAALPHGQVGALTRPHHAEEACLTTGFATEIGDGEITATMLGQAGYSLRDGYWWRSGETMHFADEFNLLERTVRSDGGRTLIGYDDTSFAPVSITDPLDSVITGTIDYRRLAITAVTDPNGTVSESLFDPLGVATVITFGGDVDGSDYGQDPLSDYTPVAATSVADVLADPESHVQNASAFLYYTLDTPCTAVRLIRDNLANGGVAGPERVNISVSYFDGYRRPLQTKKLVEPGDAILRDEDGQLVLGPGGTPVQGPVPIRWLCDGHVTYNLKQEAVRLYEPFFTGTTDYEPEAELASFGAAHRYRHDALSRPLRHDLPNQTFERTEYGPWSTTAHDPNDTVLDSGYRLLRESLPAGDPERRAYDQTVPHANTPEVAHLDCLGSTIAVAEVTTPGQPPSVTTVTRDIRGEETVTTDPRGIEALRYLRDMLNRSWRTESVDAGTEYSLIDVFDRDVHTWTPGGSHLHHRYDVLDRPTVLDVDGRRAQEYTYGEAVPDGAERNARGLLVSLRDQAGTEEVGTYSPQGEVLRVSRRLTSDYKTEPDWSGPVPLEPETYTSRYDCDALGRATRTRLADGSVRATTYATGGGITGIRVSTTDGKVTNLDVLEDAEYNSRGDRFGVSLGNGVNLSYVYDPETFRTVLRTATRGATVLSDMEYTYDPVGNIVRACDNAQQPGGGGPITGLAVSAESNFGYDAGYRLTSASGRVHQALLEHDYIPGGAGTVKGTRHLSLNNGAAVERYTRSYEYDSSGNRQRLRHNGTSRTWVSDMWISPTSNRSLPALEPSGAAVPNPEDRFDAAGNLVRLAHLRQVAWTYRGTLARAVVIERDDGPDDAEYYCYDGSGSRVRKVFERLVSGQVEATEKIYLDGCEIKRVRSNGTTSLERVTSFVGDDQRRVALIHRWNIDTTGRETDDVDAVRVRYPLGNHLDSAELELDETGAVVSYEEYFPFGGTAFVAGDAVREVRIRDYRFSGKENDDATGLYYYGHRYYAAWTGRWLSADPMGPVDGTNLYVYARNNPVTLADPNGLQSTTTDTQQGEHHVVEAPDLPPALRGVHLTPDQVRLWNRGELAIVRLPGSDAPIVMSRAEYLVLLRRQLARGVNATTTIQTRRPRRGGNSTPSRSADPTVVDTPIDQGAGTEPGGGADGSGGGTGTTTTAPGDGTGTDGTGGDSTTASGEGTTGADGNGAGSTATGGDPATGSNSGDGTGGPETGTGTGTGAGTGTGTGTGTSGTGPGAGTTGTGTGGGGTGTAPGTGSGGGAAGTKPGGGGAGAKPGSGAGTGTGTGGGGSATPGGVPGGSPTGTEQGAPGGSPEGFAGGETGGVPGGAVGGSLGGDLEHGVLGGGDTGNENGSNDGTDSRSLGGSTPGGGDTGGAAPGTGGGSNSRPGQTGSGSSGNPRPNGGNGRGGQGGHGGAGTGQNGGSQNGAPGGNPNGNPNGTPSGPGGGPGGSTGNSGGAPTTMDRVAQVAGYANLETGGDEGGRSGGIPGGMGWLHGSGWQMLYTVLTVVSLITLFASVGIKAFARGVGELARRLATVFTRQFWRGVAKQAGRMLTRRWWGTVRRRFARSRFARFFWDPRSYEKTISPQYWGARGGARGMQLHHWFFEQNGGFVGRFIPNGLKNAGWNLFAVPAFTNGYVSRTFTMGTARWFVSRGWGTAIRVAIPGSLIAGGYWGSRLGEWLSQDEPPAPTQPSTQDSSTP